MTSVPEIDCFVAAICRDMAEGGDGTRYFGSLGGYNGHLAMAQDAGLVDEAETLTDRGRAVGEACRSIPEGRAYVFARAYEDAAWAALKK